MMKILRDNSMSRRPPVALASLCTSAWIGMALICICVSGCGKQPPPGYLFRYHFHPGELLEYDISISGGGGVTLSAVDAPLKGDEMRLPVQLRGGYLLQAAIESVSPEGVARLSVSYKNFDLTMVNRVRDRETTVVLNDRVMKHMEGETVKKEVTAEDDDFPLQGISGEIFQVEIDQRGKIISARQPAAPGRLFPHLKFEHLLERIQPEFPRAAIPVGAGWSREVTVPSPGLGKPWDRGESWAIELQSTFRGFKGGDERIALIDFTGKLEQAVSPEVEKERISGLKRSSHLLTGTIEFDIKEGRLLASHTRLKQEMVILLAIKQAVPGKDVQAYVDDAIDISVNLRPVSGRKQ